MPETWPLGLPAVVRTALDGTPCRGPGPHCGPSSLVGSVRGSARLAHAPSTPRARNRGRYVKSDVHGVFWDLFGRGQKLHFSSKNTHFYSKKLIFYEDCNFLFLSNIPSAAPGAGISGRYDKSGASPCSKKQNYLVNYARGCYRAWHIFFASSKNIFFTK